VPLFILLFFLISMFALVSAPAATNHVFLMDLPAALQLAGAKSLDIQIARERLAEAQASRESALWNFLPFLSPGMSYRRHDNLIQTVEGRMIEVETDSYSVGPSLSAQLDIGDALFKELAARQLVKAADFALESQRQESLALAARGYFELARAAAAIAVARESVAISTNYAAQLEQAVGAGIAFKGDLLRVQVEAEKNRQLLRQAAELEQTAAAQLIQLLHLDPLVQLAPKSTELVPLQLTETNATLDSLVQQALSTRPELREASSRVAAARETRSGVTYGPLIPSAGAQVFAGGLGGSMNGHTGTFGESEDYAFTLGWRIGPGGLFDRSRERLAESRLNLEQLSREKLKDVITRQVLETQNHLQSVVDQLAIARRAEDSARQTLELTRQRRELGVGIVLENIQAEQELTRARLELLNLIAEHNKAQFALRRAIGSVPSKANDVSK
jgi:outer membrane protein TolC